MPIYEYQCQKCGKPLEVMQKFSDKPLKKCESCGGKLQRLISASAFHLKGSGWYNTGYAKPAPTSAETPKSESKSDVKPETKKVADKKAESTSAPAKSSLQSKDL